MEHSAAGRLEELLARGAEELGSPLAADAQERLLRLARLVADWAGRLNLTGHLTPEAVLRRLVLDALALGEAIPPFSTAVDIGSGAGFPGLAWAVRHPERQVLSVEARTRRHHFQRAALRELPIPNARALLGRAEMIPPESGDVAVAQAVARPARALAWILPWARPGGLLVLPGGERPPEPGPHPEVLEAWAVAYRVPLGGPERTAWVGRRSRSPAPVEP